MAVIVFLEYSLAFHGKLVASFCVGGRQSNFQNKLSTLQNSPPPKIIFNLLPGVVIVVCP